MKVQYGSIVVDARGKVGDVVASKNHAGNFLRELVIPVDVPSVYKTTSREQFGLIAQEWRKLQQFQRDLWNRQAMEFTILSVFATVRKPSGFHLFLSLNMYRFYIELPFLFNAPNFEATEFRSCVSLRAYGDSDDIRLTMSGPVPVNTRMLVYSSLPVSQGISKYHSTYYFLRIYATGSATEYGISESFINRFGRDIQEGEKMFVKVVYVDENTGIPSNPQFINTIAT